MGRAKNTAIYAQAAAAGVGLRQARRQLEKQAAANPPKALEAIDGVGLDGEIDRLESLAATLGEAAKQATGPERSALISDYTRVVEALRKMKGDRPDINEAEGKMVPVDEADKLMAARDNALIPLLKGMAKRLAPICANRPAAEVQAEVENEVGQIMRQVEAAL
jgi:hypothetical protein